MKRENNVYSNLVSKMKMTWKYHATDDLNKVQSLRLFKMHKGYGIMESRKNEGKRANNWLNKEAQYEVLFCFI